MKRRLWFLWLLPTELLEIQWGFITLAFGLGLAIAGFGSSLTFVAMGRVGSALAWGALFMLFGLIQWLGAVVGRPLIRVAGSYVVTGLWGIVVSLALWSNLRSIGTILFAFFALSTWYIVVHLTYELGIDWKRRNGRD